MPNDGSMKVWTKPEYETIDMNAEIGSYQEDFDGERDPVVVGQAQAPGGLESHDVAAARSDQLEVSTGGAAA